jgi:TatD DNase family protein
MQDEWREWLGHGAAGAAGELAQSEGSVKLRLEMLKMFVDSHAHLDDPQFNADRDAVIQRARAAGLRYLLTVGGGTGPERLGASLAIAEHCDWVYATVGLHPHDARHICETHFDQIRALARRPKVVAIGEIGLDYNYGHSPRQVQNQVLIRQLELAREAKLPVVVHCREAWPDLREIVAAHWCASGLGGILHCFSGTREDAFQFLGWGFLISFAGNITYKKADELRAVAREIPLHSLFTETDSPYLAPVPYRGKRNEPAHVREVTRALAALRGLSEEEMGEQAIQNFARFFHSAGL